jgi:hypothetical protein
MTQVQDYRKMSKQVTFTICGDPFPTSKEKTFIPVLAYSSVYPPLLSLEKKGTESVIYKPTS